MPTRPTSPPTIRQNAANAVNPTSMPRRRSTSASGPWPRWVRAASTEASTGSAERIPATTGPNRSAASVMTTISAAVVTTRTGSSAASATGASGVRPGGRGQRGAGRDDVSPRDQPRERQPGVDLPGRQAPEQRGGPRRQQARPPAAADGGPRVGERERRHGHQAEQRRGRGAGGELGAVAMRGEKQHGPDDQRERADDAADRVAPAARADRRRHDERRRERRDTEQGDHRLTAGGTRIGISK